MSNESELVRDLTAPPVAAAPEIYWTQPRDRDAILQVLAGLGFFHPHELDVAREVLDQALANGPDGHYQSYTARVGGEVAGWACYGPTPCTAGTFDLYWIATAAALKRRGIGAALMHRVERHLRERGGRLLIIETSGRPLYEPTRRFYLRHGCVEAARLRDFYAPGDDKVIFTKTLAGAER